MTSRAAGALGTPQGRAGPAAALARFAFLLLAGLGSEAVAALPSRDPASLGLDAVGRVSQTRGTATYRIPLILPPGTAGHAPELALVYESGSAGGAGPYGLGWQLAGPSVIERDRKFGPPYDAASCSTGVCGYREAFVLDGQDLIWDRDQGSWQYYRTQRDDGRQIRFKPSHGSGAGIWEIRDRAGRLLRYGEDSESRVRNPHNGETFSWQLRESHDAHGNLIRFSYGSGEGVVRLESVSWFAGSLGGERRVSIRYDDEDAAFAPRPDRSIDYSAGFRQVVDFRVARIEVEVRDPEPSVVTRYRLDYLQDPDSGRSLLASVVREPSEGAGEVAPHRFSYTVPASGFSGVPSSYIADAAELGAGFQEQIVNPPSYSCNSLFCIPVIGSSTVYKHLADLDGNGILDVYRSSATAVNSDRWRGDGLEYREPEIWDSDLKPYSLSWLPFPEALAPVRTHLDTLDMNGDGFPDQVSSLSEPWQVKLGSPLGFSASSVSWPGSALTGLRSVEPQPDTVVTTLELLDLTGDGLPDRVQSPGPGAAWTVEANLGLSGAQGRFAPKLAWEDPGNHHIEVHERSGSSLRALAMLLDLNGDRLPDRVYRAGAEWRVAFNRGAGFDPGEPLANAPTQLVESSPESSSCFTSHLVDLNGDGFLDAVSAGGSPPTWTVRFGTGDGFRDSAVDWTPAWSGSGPDPRACVLDPAAPDGRSTLADLDADGLPDWVLALDRVYLSLGPQPALLATATNPLGGVTRFRYGTSASPSSVCGSELNPDLPFIRPVVERIEVQDALGGAIVDEYCFAEGGYDRTEREFRGYGRVARTLLEAGAPATEIVHEYVTDAALERACAGRLAREVVSDLASGAVLSRNEFDYLAVSGPAAPERGAGWDVCLLEEIRRESVEGDEPGRKMSRTVLDYGSNPEDQLVAVRTEYGEVDPELPTSDLGSDGRRIVFRYARPGAGSDRHLVANLSELEVTDLTGTTTLWHERRYYDGLALGEVAVGDLSQVERLKDASSGTWVRAQLFGYDAEGNRTLIIGPPTRDDPDGHAVAIGYDGTFRTFVSEVARASDTPNPLREVISYRALDCAQGLAPPPGLGLPCAITRPGNLSDRFGYDAFAHRIKVERANGRVEAYDFCPSGRSPCMEDELALAFTTDPITTLSARITVDGLGRVYREEQPGHAGQTVVVLRSFDDRGRIRSETIPHEIGGPVPPARISEHDALGRISSLLSADGTTLRTFSYAPWKITEEVFFAAGTDRQFYLERTFDGRGRPSSLTQYEDVTRAAGPHTVTTRHDELDRLIEVGDPIANDPSLCQGASICLAQEHRTLIGYDLLGRRTTVRDPDAGTWSYGFDDAGLLIRERDGAGRGSDYLYDAARRPVERRMVPAGNGSQDARFEYGSDPAQVAFGRLVAAASAATGYEYQYDAAGRIAQETQRTPGAGGALVSRYVYDDLDRIRERSFPDGVRFEYRYDGLRLARVEAVGGPYQGPVLHGPSAVGGALYDPSGRLLSYHAGDSGSSGPSLHVDYDYDQATGNLLRITAEPAQASSRIFETLFDGLDRLRSQTVQGESRSFAYDGLGRLVEASGPWEDEAFATWSYRYDPLGNLLEQSSTASHSRSFDYADPTRPRFLTRFSQTTSFGSSGETGSVSLIEQLAPDPAGNPATLNTLPYLWNAQHRLHSAPRAQSRNHYDPFDRRVRQAIAGDPGTDLVYAGPDFEYDTARDVATKYLIVNGRRIASLSVSRPFAARIAGGSTRGLPLPAELPAALGGLLLLWGLAGLWVWALRGDVASWASAPATALLAFGLLHATLPLRARAAALPFGGHDEAFLAYISDHLGSVRGVVNLAGEIVSERDYTPFGNSIRRLGALSLRHRFTGGPHDDAAALYHFGARMYDPRWGRFLSPDPLVQRFDASALNRYSYVSNDPLGRIDPSGKGEGGTRKHRGRGFVRWRPTLAGLDPREPRDPDDDGPLTPSVEDPPEPSSPPLPAPDPDPPDLSGGIVFGANLIGGTGWGLDFGEVFEFEDGDLVSGGVFGQLTAPGMNTGFVMGGDLSALVLFDTPLEQIPNLSEISASVSGLSARLFIDPKTLEVRGFAIGVGVGAGAALTFKAIGITRRFPSPGSPSP